MIARAPRRFAHRSRTPPRGLLDLLRWQLLERKTPWPRWIDDPIQPPPPPPQGNQLIATYVNHATVLLQTTGGAVLTDPIWSSRCSPLSFAGPRRVRRPGLELAALPALDAVLISHNHYDHLDLPTVRQLHARGVTRFICPIDNARLMTGVTRELISELDWWESHTVSNTLQVTLVPAQHWSSRTPFDRNCALWGGFVLELGGHRIYFVGDSGYGPHFAEIAARLGPFDLCLMPVGHYEPRWFMRDQHLNPAEAVQGHLDLGSPLTLGIHFGTFQLTDEGVDEPLEELDAARRRLGVSRERFFTLPFGGSKVLPLMRDPR